MDGGSPRPAPCGRPHRKLKLESTGWENSEGEREPDRIFLDFIETSFMQQHVMEPTRWKTILDLVITSDENMIENVSVGGIATLVIIRLSGGD